MIFLILCILTTLLIIKRDTKSGWWSLLYITIVIIISALYALEYQFGNITYFVSDESVFMGVEGTTSLTEIAKSDRLLWFKILEWSSFGDITGGLFSKLVSLICIPILVYLVHCMDRKSNLSYMVFLFCPYVLYISQTALRDVMVFTISLTMLYILSKYSLKYRYMIAICVLAICISMLRPFYLYIILFSYFLSEYISYIRRSRLDVKIAKTIFALTLMSMVTFAIYFIFKDKIDQYMRTITYIMEEGSTLDESKTDIEPSFSPTYIGYALVRYALTPIPTALIGKLSDGATNFGYVHDIIRIINQSALYIMYFYIVFMFRYIMGALKNIFDNKYLLSYFIFFSANSFVYAIYYAGGGHSRLKVALFIFVFLFCDQLRIYKKDVKNKKANFIQTY